MWVRADNFQLNFGVCQTIGGTRKCIHIFIPSMHVCLSKSEDAPCILSIVEASVMIAKIVQTLAIEKNVRSYNFS